MQVPDQDIDELPRVRVIKSALKGSSSVSNAYIINTGSRGGAGVLRGRATPRRRSLGSCEELGGLGRRGSGSGSGSGAAADPRTAPSSVGSEDGGAASAAAFAPPPSSSPSSSVTSRARKFAAKKGKKKGASSAPPPPPPLSPLLPGASATTASTVASVVAEKVARRQRAAAMATLRAILDSSSAAVVGGGSLPFSSPYPSFAPASVPTFVVSCRECSRAVAGALRAAGVERFEVFSTGGGVAEERALAAALSAVVRGVRIRGKEEKQRSEKSGNGNAKAEEASAAADKENEKLDAVAAGEEEEEEEEEDEDLGARLVLSVCHKECSHASRAVSSWVAAGGRHLEPPPPRRGGGRRRRGRNGGGASAGDGSDDESLFAHENCGLSVIKAIGAGLSSVWAFLVDKPPTEEERARARQKRQEKSAAEDARRGERSTPTA